VGNVEGYKSRAEGNHVVVLNKSYPSRKETPLIKTARQNKTVFLGFNQAQANYTNVSAREVIFHINLDEEEIITKENVALFPRRPTRSLRTSSTKTESRTRSKAMPILSS